MNNSVNVQSPNFGMAYKVGNLKKMAEFLNKQEPEAINKLTTEMREASEKLKDTKYVDAYLQLDAENSKIYHCLQWKEPKFNEQGEVIDCFTGSQVGENIKEAVDIALEQEKEIAAAYEYANRQAELLKELAE